jgi:hypothetical protein
MFRYWAPGELKDPLGYGYKGFQEGGSVSKRRQRRLRGKGGSAQKYGDQESAVLRKMAKAPARGYLKRTGYQAGGEVGYGVSGPVMMSAALRGRSSDPDHAVEDASALATMPEGAPEVPTDEGEGYARGGSVRRRLGYQEGGEVDDETDEPPEMEPEELEPALQELEPEPPRARMPADAAEEEEEEPPTAAGGEEEGGGEEGGDEEGGGGGQQRAPQGEEGGDEEGGGAPTGYNAPPADQADRDPRALQEQEQAAAEPVGYQPQQAAQDSDPEQQLRDVLDYTRKQFGLDRDQHPQPRPQQVAELPEQPGVRPELPAGQAPVGLPPPPTSAPPESAGPEEPMQAPVAPQGPPQPGGMPRAPQEPAPQGQAPRTQAQPQWSDTQQPLEQYLKGDRNFTPEQMTQALDRATQQNPHLDQSGAIRKAFQDLVGRGDMDGASRFVQSLRPSYDNLRAAMTAAVGQGKFVEALQIAERLNNLIPNGNQVSFHPTENGLITAIVRPESGEAARTYHITPQQFQQYANGPSSVFDIAADAGIDRTLQAAMQKPAVNPEEAPPYQVAGPAMPPPVNPPENQPVTGAPQAPEGGVPTPRPRPMEAEAAAAQRDLGLTRESQAGAPGTQVAQRAGDVITGGRGPIDRHGLTRSQREASGWEDVRSGGFPLGKRSADTSPKYGNRVFDQDGWPTGIPRGGQFTRDMRYYDVGGHTYDVDRNGLPLAQQGQPGWQPPARGQRGWTGTTEPFNPQMPTRGADPITGRPSFNPSAIRPDQPATGYQAAQRQAAQAPPGWDQPEIPLATPTYPRMEAQQPTTTGQGQQPPAGQQQPPPAGQQQQPQTAQRQDPNLRPDGTVRNYREPYHGTPEQQRQQYQADMKEYQLRERARQMYPNIQDNDKYNRALEGLRRSESTQQAREATQQRHNERVQLDREKMETANKRADAQIKALDERNALTNMKGLVVERERIAAQELRDRVNNFMRANKDDPNAQYPYTDRDKQLIDKMHNFAIENDLADRLQTRLPPNPNAPPVRPQEPAAPAGQTTAPAPKVDLETYRGDKPPYDAPAGQQWGRSKSTGKWSLRPVEQRPTVPQSQ